MVVVRFPALGNGLFRCMGPGLPPRVAAVLDFWCAGVRSGWEWDGAVVLVSAGLEHNKVHYRTPLSIC